MARWSESHNGKFPDPYENLQTEEKRKKKKKMKLLPRDQRASYLKQQAAIREKVRMRSNVIDIRPCVYQLRKVLKSEWLGKKRCRASGSYVTFIWLLFISGLICQFKLRKRIHRESFGLFHNFQFICIDFLMPETRFNYHSCFCVPSVIYAFLIFFQCDSDSDDNARVRKVIFICFILLFFPFYWIIFFHVLICCPAV